ncbi:hypothetical protein [Tenacibaculum piscium]|uniref:hypothetical protein n=1 Tax=Tenacibaculum piscium TaxID=1458515 RepID=UPI001F2166D9|nr:hypothetical protein [Tenacibaculum piscium]
MKKLVVVVTLFFSAISFAQIEFVEKTKIDVVGQVEYVYLEKVGDEAYNLFYKNVNNPVKEYVSFSFKNIDNDAAKLHQIIVRGFEESTGSRYQIKANGDAIYFKYVRDQGIVKMKIQQYVSREPDVLTESKLLTLDEVNKIFNN